MADSSAITHSRVLKIALPIVLSNATVPILGAVDTAVVGQLGLAAPIGAVGLGAVVLASVYWIFGFLRMGTSGLAAQALGAGDRPEMSAILLRGLGIGLMAGLAFVALQGALIWGAFQLAPASAEVEALARQYLGIRIWGAPATIMLYAVTGWLIAQERTRAVLVLQFVMNGVNVVLDLWFVLGLDWGVPGVAASTLVAEYLGLMLGLWLCRKAFVPAAWQEGRLFARAAWVRMMAVNRDIMIRSVLVQGSFTTFLFLGAGMGDVTLAANQVLLQFMEITAYALDGFAFAAEALIGQAVGARKRRDFRQAAVVSGQWGLGFSVILALAFALGGGALIDVMTTSAEVREAARVYLPWMVAAPLIAIASYMLDGVFIGATRTAEMRNSMMISALVYGGALLVLVPLWGNHGLWLALMIFNMARGLTLGWLYPKIERAV